MVAERAAGPGGAGEGTARGVVVTELAGRDAVMDRLLRVAREELGAEVLYLPGPVAPEPLPHTDVPVADQSGVPGGVLRFRVPAGEEPPPVEAEVAVRILSRFVGEQLGSWDRAYADWQERTQRMRTVLDHGVIDMVFQPVADLRTGEVVGVEALSRFPGAPPLPPDRWFGEASAVGLSVDLEVLAVRSALPALAQLPADVYLSINLSPVAAMSRELSDALDGHPLDRIIIEITEHAQIDDYDELNRTFKPLRSEGLRIAVDDTGSGFASLRHILQVAPDVIKLDTTLTHGIDNDAVLRALAYSISSFASAIEATVVAEGVETESELDALRFLHVACGQGFYLRRPGTLPAALQLNPAVFSQSSPA